MINMLEETGVFLHWRMLSDFNIKRGNGFLHWVQERWAEQIIWLLRLLLWDLNKWKRVDPWRFSHYIGLLCWDLRWSCSGTALSKKIKNGMDIMRHVAAPSRAVISALTCSSHQHPAGYGEPDGINARFILHCNLSHCFLDFFTPL